MIPPVLGNLCASYLGLCDVSMLLSNSYRELLPYTLELEQQMHIFHSDMQYADVEWIMHAEIYLDEKKYDPSFGYLYFCSRLYHNIKACDALEKKHGEKLKVFRFVTSLVLYTLKGQDDLWLEIIRPERRKFLKQNEWSYHLTKGWFMGLAAQFKANRDVTMLTPQRIQALIHKVSAQKKLYTAMCQAFVI